MAVWSFQVVTINEACAYWASNSAKDVDSRNSITNIYTNISYITLHTCYIQIIQIIFIVCRGFLFVSVESSTFYLKFRFIDSGSHLGDMSHESTAHDSVLTPFL